MQACQQGADKQATGAAAHLRSVSCVSLRMGASSMALTSPMLLWERLRARGRMGSSEGVDCEQREWLVV